MTDIRQELPYGFVYGSEYSRAKPKRQDTEPARDALQVMPVFDAGFRQPFLHQLMAKPKLHDGLERLLGKGFVLGNTIVHTVRAGTPRLPFHKDGHGMALGVVLIDDIGWDEGRTSLQPATHTSSPPPSYYMEDVCARPAKEVQTVGKAGDAYIVCADGWHGRAANVGQRDTAKV